ncbi:M20/M25/M40 family metallo-hydrolase [Agromyces protaetiae]|uniref:M20/M25/M40 family metallo-hydrolase n=1 Tax=Agromyces protaetiae TaxID=2509455 RepID=A0A4V0YHJ7_9MICO|nr:M20/M25/M40 family metallo-hydrolase [Agromyces protaetiae]
MATLVERLRLAVALESPTGDARAIAALGAHLTERFTRLGAAVSVEPHETGPNLAFAFPGTAGRESEAPVLFLAHADTVWPVGTLASTMPWRDDDGIVAGPGAFDMKGGIIAFEGALELLAESGAAHRPLTLLLVADEEIGSPSSRALVESHGRCAVAVLGLESPHADGALKTARLGSTRVRLTVVGRESHAALDPDGGVSAIEELVDQLLRVREIAAAHPTVLCNVGTIAGGGRTNVVAGRAHADIGFRFPDASTERAVLDALAALAPVRSGGELSVEVLSSRPAWGVDARHDALTAEIAAAAATVGQAVDGRPATGAADTNLTGALGVPTVDGLGPRGAGAHAVHEHVVAASLAERAELIAALLARI